MMSLWELVWIVPLCVTAGLFLACLMAAGRDDVP